MVRTLHLEQWAGQWVAIDQHSDVVASADTVEALLGRLKADGIEGVEIMQAPDPGGAVSYGVA